jgi:hypothetical protein
MKANTRNRFQLLLSALSFGVGWSNPYLANCLRCFVDYVCVFQQLYPAPSTYDNPALFPLAFEDARDDLFPSLSSPLVHPTSPPSFLPPSNSFVHPPLGGKQGSSPTSPFRASSPRGPPRRRRSSSDTIDTLQTSAEGPPSRKTAGLVREGASGSLSRENSVGRGLYARDRAPNGDELMEDASQIGGAGSGA